MRPIETRKKSSNFVVSVIADKKMPHERNMPNFQNRDTCRSFGGRRFVVER